MVGPGGGGPVLLGLVAGVEQRGLAAGDGLVQKLAAERQVLRLAGPASGPVVQLALGVGVYATC